MDPGVDIYIGYQQTLRSIAHFFSYILQFAKQKNVMMRGMNLVHDLFQSYAFWKNDIDQIFAQMNLHVQLFGLTLYMPGTVSKTSIRNMYKNAVSSLNHLVDSVPKYNAGSSIADETDSLLLSLRLANIYASNLDSRSNIALNGYNYPRCFSTTDIVFSAIVKQHPEIQNTMFV